LLGDLLERHPGLSLWVGEWIHLGLEARRAELARDRLAPDLLQRLADWGHQRGLAEGRRFDAERAASAERQLESALRGLPSTPAELRRAARETFEQGVEAGLEARLAAAREALVLADALTRRLHLSRVRTVRQVCADLSSPRRALLLECTAEILEPQGGEGEPADALLRALDRVQARPGPRREFLRALLSGDEVGAAAARLLLELKGLPFDRSRKLAELYGALDPEQVHAVEERFAAAHSASLRDPRWLVPLKALASALVRLVGARPLARRLAPIRGPQPLDRVLEHKLRPGERAALERWRRGDRRGARLEALDLALARGDGATLAERLGDLPEPALRELEESFHARHGRALAAAAAERLPSGCARDRVLALLRRDPRLARAALLRGALAQVRGCALAAAFAGLDDRGRQRLVEDYELHYASATDEGALLRGDFAADLRRFVGGAAYPLVEHLVRHGGLGPEDLVRYYLLGLGTNVPGLLALLRPMSRAQLEECERRYDRKYRIHGARRLRRELPPRRAAARVRAERARFGWRARWVDLPLFGALYRHLALTGGLRADLRSEVSGDAWFDVRDALRGAAERDRPEEVRARLLDRRGHELSGGLVQRWRPFRELQQLLDADLERCLAYFDRDLSPLLAQGLAPAPASLRRFHHLARLATVEFDHFRTVKRRTGALLGERLGGLGATVGAFGATAIERAVQGQGTWLVLLLGGTVGAFLGKYLPKKWIGGDALGTEELGVDLVHALVDGVGRLFSRLRRLSSFALGGLQPLLGRTAFTFGARRTLDQLTRGLGSRWRARRDRLPELSTTLYRPRPGTAGPDRSRGSRAVVGVRFEHPEDRGLERVLEGLRGGP
jgi:hypothetical protein